jgi:hypothetical protein
MGYPQTLRWTVIRDRGMRALGGHSVQLVTAFL